MKVSYRTWRGGGVARQRRKACLLSDLLGMALPFAAADRSLGFLQVGVTSIVFSMWHTLYHRWVWDREPQLMTVLPSNPITPQGPNVLISMIVLFLRSNLWSHPSANMHRTLGRHATKKRHVCLDTRASGHFQRWVRHIRGGTTPFSCFVSRFVQREFSVKRGRCRDVVPLP